MEQRERRPRLRWLRLPFLCGLAMLQVAAVAWGSENHGQVFFGGVPVPGATVTVTQGDKKIETVTDRQGLYEFEDIADGVWKIRIEMRGFSSLDGEITVAPNTPQGTWELKLLDLDQMLAQTKVIEPENKSLQTRDSSAAEATQKKPSPNKEEASVPETPRPAEESDRSNDGLLITGSESNAATSPFSLTPAFGNRRPGAKSLYTGGIGAIVGNSVFDARPYSLTGLELPKASFSTVTTVVTLGGPLN